MGFVEIYKSSGTEEDCLTVENPPVDLPSGAITDDITIVNLPSRSNFGSIKPIRFQDNIGEFYGQSLYSKNSISGGGCDEIPYGGIYSNTIGEFPNGDQVIYAGHLELDENTLENPISDGGALMNSLSPVDDMNIICPVASKSFVNGK